MAQVFSGALSERSQVVFQGMFGAREGHLCPGEVVSWEAPDVHRLVERRRLAARDLGREDGYGWDLFIVGIETDDLTHLDLQPRLFEHFAPGGGLGPLAALHETAGESPLSVARLDVALDQDYTPVQLGDGPGYQLGSQVENKATVAAH